MYDSRMYSRQQPVRVHLTRKKECFVQDIVTYIHIHSDFRPPKRADSLETPPWCHIWEALVYQGQVLLNSMHKIYTLGSIAQFSH